MLNSLVRIHQKFQMPANCADPNWQLSRNHHWDVRRSRKHQRGGLDGSKDLAHDEIPEGFELQQIPQRRKFEAIFYAAKFVGKTYFLEN